MASSNDEDSGSDVNEGDWADWRSQDDDGEEATCSLFDGAVLPSPDAALDYDASTHSFDLRQFRIQVQDPSHPMHARTCHLPAQARTWAGVQGRMGAETRHCWRQAGLDDYSTIRCVNYIRSEVSAQRDPRPSLAAAAQSAAAGSPQPWDGDQYMKPVLADDPLLFYEYDDVQPTCEPCTQLSTPRPPRAPPGSKAPSGLQRKLCRLRGGAQARGHSAACACDPADRRTLAGWFRRAAEGGGAALAPATLLQDELSRLRAENDGLREVMQRLVAAHAEPDLLELAQVCTADPGFPLPPSSPPPPGCAL